MTGRAERDPEPFELRNFFPYRLTRFSEDVSRAIAQLYSGRFKLSRHEWRVIAVLGEQSELTAKEIAEYTTLDKTQVSRATARLLAEELISRRESPRDRRHLHHNLTRKGRGVYEQIVPLVVAREGYILSALTGEELQQLNRLIDKVHAKALELQRWG